MDLFVQGRDFIESSAPISRPIGPDRPATRADVRLLYEDGEYRSRTPNAPWVQLRTITYGGHTEVILEWAISGEPAGRKSEPVVQYSGSVHWNTTSLDMAALIRMAIATFDSMTVNELPIQLRTNSEGLRIIGDGM